MFEANAIILPELRPNNCCINTYTNATNISLVKQRVNMKSVHILTSI